EEQGAVGGTVRGRQRRRLKERGVLGLRRRGAAGREVPVDAEAAAHDCLAVAVEIVRETGSGAEVRLRVRLQPAADLDAVDRRVVRGDDERAGALVEV